MKKKLIAQCSACILVLLGISAIVLKNDFIYMFKIWLSLLIMGITFFPISSTIFSKFHDRGWIFSKVIGFSIPGLIVWLLAYAQIAKFSAFSCYAVCILGLIGNVGYWMLKRKRIRQMDNQESSFNDKVIKGIIISECFFIAFLSMWIYLKGLQPGMTNGTEQFMDYGFLNSIINSEYMPPKDIWFSGAHINYYYFGLYISAFICKVAGIGVNAGYNLINAMLASFSFVMPYTIGYQLLLYVGKKKKINIDSKVPWLSMALVFVFAICIGIGGEFGGSMHYPIYRFMSEKKEQYYYPDETRYIGTESGEDSGVCEKPAYSNVLGDLHAHYIAIIFSYTILAILLDYFLSEKQSSIKKALLDYHFIIVGLLLGMQKMTNYWDLPIYIVIISVVIITKELMCNGCERKDVLRTIAILFEIILLQIIVALPFSFDLVISTTQVRIAPLSSPLYKLLVLWGLPVLCYVSFFVFTLVKFINSGEKIKEYLSENLSDAFVVLIGVCAIGLVIIPELVYLKDIYGDEYLRFNTMFKLTYEAFLLFNISTVYAIYQLVNSKSKILIGIGSLLMVCQLSTYVYGFDAINSVYKDLSYVGIDKSENFIRSELPDDYEAIQWIKSNISKDKVILEAVNSESSYSTFARISTFTGNPTVLGWTVHEWLWRTDSSFEYPKIVSERVDEVFHFYNDSDIESAKNFIDKYDISYVYIGEKEYVTYPDMDINFLVSLGEVVYNSEEHGTYIIKVK